MIKVLKLLSFFLFPVFALKAEIHINQLSEKESSQKMFAVIYQGYLKPDRENEYQKAWNKVAQYFINHRGAIGSCLHKTTDGLWVAYSRWPDKKTRDNSWPGENTPSEELPLEIRKAVFTIKDCLDADRKIPDLCMEVVNDLLLSSDKTESIFSLSPEQERIMNSVYEEIEIAIQEGNPPFAAIITDFFLIVCIFLPSNDHPNHFHLENLNVGNNTFHYREYANYIDRLEFRYKQCFSNHPPTCYPFLTSFCGRARILRAPLRLELIKCSPASAICYNFPL